MHARIEVSQLLLIQRVIQAQHRGAVRDLHSAFARPAADADRGGIRRAQLRVRGFEIAKLAHQFVEFGVRDLGLIQNVIAVLVMFQLLPQLFGTLNERLFHSLNL